jgi:hypothetical protein
LKGKDGLPIGRANNNPILDTRMYEVEYPNGQKASLAANVIAENLFAQVNNEGNRHVLFGEIIDHQTDGTEVKQQDAFLTMRNGNQRQRETTKGWEIIIQWKDSSTTWVSMKDIKNSYLVQLAKGCNTEKNCGRACFCVVDLTCSAQVEQNHRKAKDKV